MKSRRPRCCMRWPAARCLAMRWPRSRRARRGRRRDRAGPRRCRGRGRGALAGGRDRVQAERRGTAHAVLAARAALRAARTMCSSLRRHAAVRAGDVRRYARSLADGARSSCWVSRRRDPTGYGRLIIEGGAWWRSASTGRERGRARDPLLQRRPDGARRRHALSILDAIGNDNAQKRILPDRRGRGRRSRGLEGRRGRVRRRRGEGINDRAQLAGGSGIPAPQAPRRWPAARR